MVSNEHEGATDLVNHQGKHEDQGAFQRSQT